MSCCHSMICYYRLVLQLGQQVLYLPVSMRKLCFLVKFTFRILGTACLYIASSSRICFVCNCAVSEHLRITWTQMICLQQKSCHSDWLNELKVFHIWQKINPRYMMLLSRIFPPISPLVYNLDWAQVIEYILAPDFLHLWHICADICIYIYTHIPFWFLLVGEGRLLLLVRSIPRRVGALVK